MQLLRDLQLPAGLQFLYLLSYKLYLPNIVPHRFGVKKVQNVFLESTKLILKRNVILFEIWHSTICTLFTIRNDETCAFVKLIESDNFGTVQVFS